MSNQDRIDKLSSDLERLVRKQKDFVEEIRLMKNEIDRLQAQLSVGKIEKQGAVPPATLEPTSPDRISKTRILVKESKEPLPKKAPGIVTALQEIGTRSGRDLERFIGENLINKIGILIIIIGVGIGAKYSIDNNLVSPELRIILGYLVGIILLATGIKLKSAYLNYSAVLTSGALAIFYFITYFAYTFYGLIPQSFAFGLMTFFTIFGVVAALNYNQQVIALIGLTGAYALPFLLGGESDDIVTLFLYITIINIGILIIAVRKYWHLVHYTAFILTWLIYAFWYHSSNNHENDVLIGLLFSSVFFILFYTTFIINKLLKKLAFSRLDIILILGNSFLFYGYGYALILWMENGENLVGLFTIANALIHLVVSAIIFKNKLADRNLFYFVSGLVLIFLTIAIPVQLTGSWVTLLWAGEALVLFWIGHTRSISFYKKLSYPLIFLAFFSQSLEWASYVNDHSIFLDNSQSIRPFLHPAFFTSILYALLLGGINYLAFVRPGTDTEDKGGILQKMMYLFIPGLFLFVVYTTFRIEIQLFWQMIYEASKLEVTLNNSPTTLYNYNIIDLEHSWIINYTLLFLIIVSLIILRWFKQLPAARISLFLNMTVILIFLTAGLSIHGELRSNYQVQLNAEYYNIGIGQLGLRYISYLLVAFLWILSLKYFDKYLIKNKWNWLFQLALHVTILTIASYELIHWLSLAESTQSDKLGLSILWGIYALLLIILGIWKKQKFLRIAAIALFSVTLIKLFTYDLSSLSTVGKTIVFVSLGILLLIISFLYNKYKNLIRHDVETD